jgi:hypothetical protein
MYSVLAEVIKHHLRRLIQSSVILLCVAFKTTHLVGTQNIFEAGCGNALSQLSIQLDNLFTMEYNYAVLRGILLKMSLHISR